MSEEGWSPKVGEDFHLLLWQDWGYEKRSMAVGKVLAIVETEDGPVATIHLPAGFDREFMESLAADAVEPYSIAFQADGSVIMGCDTDWLFPPEDALWKAPARDFTYYDAEKGETVTVHIPAEE